MSNNPWDAVAPNRPKQPGEYRAEGNTIFSRALSGAFQLPDFLLRGIFKLGQATLTDTERAAHQGLRAMGVETDRGNRALEREALGPELLKGIGESFANTSSAIRDVSYVPNLLQGAVEEGSLSGAFSRANEAFGQRAQEFSDDPAMFALEHVGNVAIGGALAAKPAQLGTAASRGVLTGAEAIQGLRPLAGRGSRRIARDLVSQEATLARQAGHTLTPFRGERATSSQVINLMDNAISHPYITAGRKIGQGGRVLNQTPYVSRIRESDAFRKAFNPEVREARHIVRDRDSSMPYGVGRIANAANRTTDVTGNINLRRRYDPSRTERMFLRDINNLSKRNDAGRFRNLINDLPLDRVTGSSIPGRISEVISGERAIGQVISPDDLITQAHRVIEEARVKSANNPSPTAMTEALKDILPGVDPMGLHLMALDAADIARGVPQGTLSGALSDFITMDRFGDLNRQAQAAMRGLDNVTPERFRLPDDALNVNINSLPQKVQDIFYDAAGQHRRNQATLREPTLRDAGVLSETDGTRIGLSAEQPTRFEGRATSPEAQQLRLEQESLLRNVETTRKTLDDLEGSQPFAYRNNRPGQASIDNSWRSTPTAEASRRWRETLDTQEGRIREVSAKLDELDELASIDPSQAPVTARNLLTYTNEVAPEQARVLRSMADEGQGNPDVLRALAAELDAAPRTIQELNSAEVYVSYLRDIKGLRPDGTYGPGSGRPIDTRLPRSTTRRNVADTLDVKFERDYRTRAYWQESEFQNYFMNREADRWVRNSKLAQTGKSRLIEAGYTETQLNNMSHNQLQQALEQQGLRAYNPDQLFGSGRQPSPPGRSPLEAEWITPQVENVLMKASNTPSQWERVLGEGLFDPLTNAWKVSVLPLRFAWQVNNAFGNFTLATTVGGVSLLDYPALARASSRAVRNWNRGIISEVEIPLSGVYRAELTAKLNTLNSSSNQASLIRGMLDNNTLRISNEVMYDVASQGITRGDFAFLNNSQFMRDATGRKNILRQFDAQLPQLPGELGRRGRNIRQTAREGVDYAYHLNETVDNFHRAIVYMDQIGKGSSHSQAIAQVNKALGDYSKLSRFERRVLKRIYPFYPWMQHVARVIGHSVHPSNIQQTMVTSHILSILGQPNEMEEMLPDWAGGHVYVGDAQDGTPRFLSTRGLNPFLDVFDPISQRNMSGIMRPIHPAIQFGYEQISGVSTLTNRPFSSPSGPGSGDRPPIGEYFFKNVPQAELGRRVYRDLMDQPLTRYGTGEPILRFGQDNKSSLQYLAQLGGLNIQTMDVQNMQRQEKLAEFRRESNLRRQSMLEETRGGNTLSDLPSMLFGR